MKNIKTEKYNIFHQDISIQKKIISKNNFTYFNLIKILSLYLKEKNEILDIGCGAGTIDYYLARKGNFVTGIDISDKAISSNKNNCKIFNLSKNLNFIKLNFPTENINKKFDCVILSEVLEHIELETSVIKKIFLLLKNNGLLIVSVPSINSPLFKLKLLSKFDKKVGHLRRYSCKTLSGLLTKNGFSVIKKYKTEGILRNILFIYPFFAFFIKILNNSIILSKIFSAVDNVTLWLFGESNIIIVAQKK